MSRASRKLQVGAKVYTDYSGKITEHEIIERLDNVTSQSCIGFRVRPMVPKSGDQWLDADWFEPVPAQEGKKGENATPSSSSKGQREEEK